MFGVHPFRLADFAGSRFHVVPPMVASGRHAHVSTGALIDDAGLQMLAATHRNGFINNIFDRQRLASTHLLIGRDDRDRTGIDDALLHRLG